MLNIVYFIIFVLLLAGTLCIMEINPVKRKLRLSVSKSTADDKRKKVDEKYARLKWNERILVSIKNTVTMSGFKLNTFWLLVFLSGFLGCMLGKFLFAENILAVVTGLIVLPMPYIVLKIRARWYKRNQDELLENTMNLITIFVMTR